MTSAFLIKARLYALCIRSRLRALFYTWSTIIGFLIASRGVPNVAYLISGLGAIISMSLLSLGVYIYNDVLDIESDKTNKVDRPIAQEKITKKDAMTLVLFLFFTGMLVSFSTNLLVFSLTAVYLLLAVAYSTPPLHLKKRFYLKQLTIAVGCFISSIIGGASVGVISGTVLFSGFIFFMFAIGLSPLADLADMEGDKRKGVLTFPVVWGPEATLKLATITIILIAVTGIAGYQQLGFNLALPILFGLACVGCMVVVIRPLYGRRLDSVYYRAMQKRIMLILFAVQASMLVGTI